LPAVVFLLKRQILLVAALTPPVLDGEIKNNVGSLQVNALAR